MKSRVSVVRCDSYAPELVQKAVEDSVNLLGGITNFIRPKSRVLLKPNLLMAIEPEQGITTHPEVVRSIARILKGIDCTVFVGDGPSVWDNQIRNVSEVYRRTGMTKVCQEEGLRPVYFDKKRMCQKFPLTSWLDHCDYLINLPKFKTHALTCLTGAIKNLFGLVWGTFKLELHKNYFHTEDFAKILVDIYAETRPALTIVDGISAIEGDGPATRGLLCFPKILVAGSDCVSVDSVLSRIMGIEPLDVPSTREAVLRGLGIADMAEVEILGERLDNLKIKPFSLPATSQKRKLPQPIINLAKKLIRYYPCMERNRCIRCSACIKICPKAAISMGKKGVLFDYSRCIACFCCHEVCLAAAIKIRKTIFTKIMGL
ncbi:MAG: DUF362 domain-containing protein [Candidatus Omnitrophica bacterium]|nr:DUF362 domain-containing protein [Candidatus Omnitrophota bacterium]